MLRQAWNDRLRPILVINKVDRLVTELRLTPNEAYHHLVQLIEQVNAVMGSFFAAERMEDDLRWREDREKRINARKEKQEEDAVNAASSSAGNDDADPEYEEHDDEDIYFDPSRGNVIFGSAIDNWAFRLERFSVLYAKKLGIQESRFRKVLWGDYYFDTKNKRVIGQKQREKEKRNLKPMFVQFVLDNIWAVYDSIVLNRDQEKIEKIVKTLELKILPRDLKSKDHSGLLSAVFSQWLPLASCTFSAVVSNIPSPKEAQALRIPKLLQPGLSYFAADKELEPQTEVQRDMYTAKPGQDAFKVAYVSKMFAVKREDLPEGRRKNLTAEEMRARAKDSRERARAIQAATGAQVNGDAEHQTSNGMSLEEAQAQAQAAAQRDNPTAPSQTAEAESDNAAAAKPESDEVIIGFSRLYSGSLRVGASMMAILPKYNPKLGPSSTNNAKHLKEVKIEGLYMMMGRELIAVQEVPAGNVFGIRGIEKTVLRNATLFAPPDAHLQGPEKTISEWLNTGENASQLVNLSGVSSTAAPIVRIALEPKNPCKKSLPTEPYCL